MLCLHASDSDLHMTALALELCCALMSDRRSNPNVGLTVRNKVLPQALTLVKSSLLQGQALTVISRSWSGTSISIKVVCFVTHLFLDIVGFTKFFRDPGLLSKYKLWCSARVSYFNSKAISPGWWCCKTGLVFNSSVCCCSLPCCRWPEMFVHSKHAYRNIKSWQQYQLGNVLILLSFLNCNFICNLFHRHESLATSEQTTLKLHFSCVLKICT